MKVTTALFCAAASAAACGGTSANSPAPATTTESADEGANAALREYHRYHHHGGLTLFVAMSLDTLGVSPERRAAVEKIRTGLHAGMEPARAAEQSLMTILAEGVASATFDTAKIDAAVTSVTAAARAARDASTEALDELHAALTPPERGALVDKVESHWAVWQKANIDDDRHKDPDADRLATLATDLGLTDPQVATIRAQLGKPARGDTEVNRDRVTVYFRTFGEAFRSDKFDAKSLAAQLTPNANAAGWGAVHMAHFVETVTPVLTPEQRSTFAQTLREHAAHDSASEVQP